jgi:hypothetical protein
LKTGRVINACIKQRRRSVGYALEEIAESIAPGLADDDCDLEWRRAALSHGIEPWQEGFAMRYARYYEISAVVVCCALSVLQSATADDAPAAKAAPAKNLSTVCVQVRIGTGQPTDFHCLNALLAKLVDQESTRQAALQAAQDGITHLAPTQLGLFNETATHERLGNAFGHSAFPQRPNQTFNVPLIH